MRLLKTIKNESHCIIRKPSYSYNLLFLENNQTKPLEFVILDMLKDEFFTTSIYWSSPELYEAIEHYKKGSLQQKNEEKLIQTLKKYVVRTSTRATPYGTFAGIGSYNFTAEEIDRKSLRTARVDMEFFEDLKRKIENNPYYRPLLKYGICSTVYEMAGNYRYTEPFEHHNHTKYQLSEVEKNDFIDLIYSKAKAKEWWTLTELYSLLPNDFSQEEVAKFIEDLISSGFLVTEISQMKDFENLSKIVRLVEEKYFSDRPLFGLLFNKINHCINLINNTNPSYLPKKEIEALKKELGEYHISSKNLFHIDLLRLEEDDIIYKNLFKEYSSDISHAIELIYSLSENQSSTELKLQEFKKAFQLKYENQLLPLLDVLDSEFGIGFPVESSFGNLVDEQLIVASSTENKKEDLTRSPNQKWLFEKIDQHPSAYEVVIEEQDFSVEANASDYVSENFSVMGSFHDEYFHIQNVGGSTTSLLGRFAYMDQEIEDICKSIREKEQEKNSQIVFADIRYIPNGKIANVVRNDSFSDYEICILTEPTKPEKKQILLTDLYVTLQNGELILWSKKLQKRVVPKLSNAFNFNNSNNGIFKFLCALQINNTKPLNFIIDYKSNTRRFFPRIVFKSVIIHRASWVIRRTDLQEVKFSASPINSLKYLLKKLGVTQFVSLLEGDNELFIDIHNGTYLEMLWEEVKNKSLVVLSEWLKPISPIGYADQIIINYENTEAPSLFLPKEKPISVNIQREFLPGSEWIYFKIYCSSGYSDEIIKNVLQPYLEELLSNNKISLYFFLRFTDPHYHLRVRIFARDITFVGSIISQFNLLLKPYLENKSVWKVQLDTYQREIERYGEEFMQDTEQLFYYDTQMYMQTLANDYFEIDENFRVFSAIKNIDHYLSIFDLTLKERYYFCKKIEDAFEQEMGKDQKKLLYSKFRNCAQALYEFMISKEMVEEFELHELKVRTLQLDVSQLSNYIHMSINRWFTANQRIYEYMSYIFLKNYYNRLLNTNNSEFNKEGE